MKIAIVHYHLRRGGVTRVLESCVPLLAGAGHEVVILTGEPPVFGSPLEEYAVVLGALGYDHRLEPANLDDLMDRMTRAAAERLRGVPDVWHFHNHHLGKNFHVTAVTGALAARGDRLLLQIHDFPEDGRQINYSCLRFISDNEGWDRSQFLYPTGTRGRVHYGVLNSRDRGALLSSGLSASHLHSLPNPIGAPSVALDREDNGVKVRDSICTQGESRFVLYPSRSIRRKNIGEVILWGMIAARSGFPFHIGLTLKPENPDAIEVYQNWKDWTEEVDIPVTFELGLDPRWSFEDLLSAADGFISTSVAEGFGLPFLEPWLLGKGIVGRDIPQITADFVEQGIDFGDGLYQSISVPLDWLHQRGLRYEDELARSLEQSFESYGLAIDEESIHEAIRRRTANGVVDFSSLTERQMNAVISVIRSDSDFVDALSPHSLPEFQSGSLIQKNAARVRESYCPREYVSRLDRIYHQILEEDGDSGAISADKVLLSYLDPDRFLFLCS